MSNHLGNVLVTITGKKKAVAVPRSSLMDYFEAEVVTAQDYYPFGIQKPKRSDVGAFGYRYGFNGKGNDNDIKGLGNQQDYGMRICDPSLRRFLSVDPLIKGFAFLTPYQFSSNSPVANIDLDGGEAKYFNIVIEKTFDGQGKLISEESTHIEDKSKEAGLFAHGSFIYRSPGSLGNGTLFTYTEVTRSFKKDGTESILIADKGALYIPSEDDKGRGGFYFVPSSGGFSGKTVSLNGADAIPINIALLVKAVGGFPRGNADTEMSPFQYSGNEAEKLAKLIEIMKSDKSFAVKLDKLLGGVKALINAEKAGEKAGTAIDQFLSDQQLKENDRINGKGAEYLQCESCNAYRKAGTRTVMPATKKDTANKGINPKNTQKVTFEGSHSN